ncbi:MAG TPA: hypothetical protein VMR45_01745 [Patescibacteria group bacterium]|jgi:cytochrome oxidase assembly protein ShyY1|nr:hypothetical protein [Patescibacteria group bacterium]
MARIYTTGLIGWYDRLGRNAAAPTGHPIKFLIAWFILSALYITPLVLLAAPALILFSLAAHHPNSRTLFETIGVIWLLFLGVFFVVLLITLTVVVIRRASRKKKLIQDYEERTKSRGRYY